MPKKTKKQKILVEYRRKLRLLERSVTSRMTEEKVIPAKAGYSPPQREIPKQPPQKYFFSDLRKSLILVVVIIALEIGLYFAKLIR